MDSNTKKFYTILAVCTLVAAVAYRSPSLAMWVGFAFAGYSVVANDSIQTLGTFLSSNRHRPWWLLWVYVGGIFLVTTACSWFKYTGDVTYGRLASKGFETAPESFAFLQICAPLVLLILTRYSVPVSTTFLILSAFTTSGTSLKKVVLKSVSGYFIAFICAFGLWLLTYHLFRRFKDQPAAAWWTPAQWVTSGLLWSVWIMQDAANVAVYLPRSLEVWQLLLYCILIFSGLGLLLYRGGGEIQGVVGEKHETHDVRQATCIDFVYALILYYFKIVSSIPMSTTWVFIGLLAGRELGITISSKGENRTRTETAKMVARDVARVSLGLFISIVLAMVVNPVIRESILGV